MPFVLIPISILLRLWYSLSLFPLCRAIGLGSSTLLLSLWLLSQVPLSRCLYTLANLGADLVVSVSNSMLCVAPALALRASSGMSASLCVRTGRQLRALPHPRSVLAGRVMFGAGSGRHRARGWCLMVLCDLSM